MRLYPARAEPMDVSVDAGIVERSASKAIFSWVLSLLVNLEASFIELLGE